MKSLHSLLLALIGLAAVLAACSAGPATPTPDPALALAEAGVTSNSEWTPYTQEFDGVPMVLVPSGCFRMGTTETERKELQRMVISLEATEDEAPATDMCIKQPFWLDKTEVTREQYLRLGGTELSDEYKDPKDGGLPVQGFDWRASQEFCEMRGGSLPSEVYWEYAARGPDRLTYPWGNEYVEDIASKLGAVPPAGSHPADISWVGALDMGASMMEWTGGLLGPYPVAGTGVYKPEEGEILLDKMGVVRGASWRWDYTDARAANRNPMPLGAFNNDMLGFRCMRLIETEQTE